MNRKSKDQSLKELMDSVPSGTLVTIPIENLAKDDYQRIFGVKSIQDLLDLEHRASNRDLILVVVGVLEGLVTTLLKQFVVTTYAEKLFGRQGKVRDLEAKADLAFGLGLISSEERINLNILRRIRNAFAHDPDLHHFEGDEKVLGLVRSLALRFRGQPFDISLRWRIITTTIGLHHSLSKRLSESVASTRNEYKDAEEL